MFLRKYIGDKEFYKTTLALALPMMFQGLLVSISGLIDNMMVANLGDSFLSGVAAANRFFIIYNFGVNGVVLAAGVFIGQYLGAKNKKKMQESFRASIILGYLLALPFFLLVYFKSELVLRFFSNDINVIKNGVDYYKAIVWTMLPLTLSLAIGTAIRSTGDTKSPIIASTFGIATNLIFNYLLIGGNYGFPALGVYGAGIATLISRFVEVIIMITLMLRKNYDFNTKLSDLFKIDKKLFKLISKNAFNIGANEILWSSSMAFLMKFYATRGPIAMSAYSISGSVSDIFFVLFGGMSAATTVLVGHQLGANNFEKAKDNGYKLLGFSLMLSVVFGFSLFMISNLIPLIYREVSYETQKTAITLVRIIGLLFWTFMYNVQILFMLRAGGDSFSAFVMDSGFMWFFNLPIVGLFTYLTDIPIIYLYLIGHLTDVVKLIVSTLVFKKELWVKNVTEFH